MPRSRPIHRPGKLSLLQRAKPDNLPVIQSKKRRIEQVNIENKDGNDIFLPYSEDSDSESNAVSLDVFRGFTAETGISNFGLLFRPARKCRYI
jgi:hypothetical protein